MRFILGIIFIIASIGIFFGFTNPQYQEAKVVRAEVARFDEALDRAKELTALRDELAARYNSFSPEELRRLNTLLPDSIDTVRLIIDVDNIGKGHNLSLLNITVTGETSGASTAFDARPYGVTNLTFNVSTTYDQFKSFLRDLERSLRVLDVESITFGTPDPLGRTTYAVRANTYWLR